MSTERHEWTLDLTRRVRFAGRLRMTSALHVGSGDAGAASVDDRVLRHPGGRPFIPGSSLKGALRSHLERVTGALARAAGKENGDSVFSCRLYEQGETTCPTPGWIDEGKDATQATEDDFEALCHTCTLFGSPILAGKIALPDLDVLDETYAGRVEVRDGVGVNRDRGKAQDGILFDYEVVPSGTAFAFELSADSPDDDELALLSVAVRELQRGNVRVGGKTTRGLGACALEDVTIYDADFSTLGGLEQHLKEGDETPVADPDAFLDDHIQPLFD